MVGGRGTHYCPHCQHHPYFPFVIGITGEIATGKSTFIQEAKRLGIPSIESDKLVHDFYQTRHAVQLLKKVFPESIVNQKIDRKKLLDAMVQDRGRYDKWINILFPIVKKSIDQQLLKSKSKLVLLEVPLLFQGKIDAFTDINIGIESSKPIQTKRLKERNPETADALLILNERNDYRNYLSFIDQRLINTGNLQSFKTLIQKTLKPYLNKL
jgi:dephospho-CoA kinase